MLKWDFEYTKLIALTVLYISIGFLILGLLAALGWIPVPLQLLGNAVLVAYFWRRQYLKTLDHLQSERIAGILIEVKAEEKKRRDFLERTFRRTREIEAEQALLRRAMAEESEEED